MATTFGTRPEDASADSRGNINVGVVHTLYPTEADALARTSPIGTATTNELGLWPFEDSANRLSLWVRNPAGNVWPVEAEGALASKANQSDVDAALAAKIDTTVANATFARLGSLASTAVQYVSTAGNDSAAGTSWGAAKATVGAAVAAIASTGGRVLVGPGTYPLAASLALAPRADQTGIEVVGAGAQLTILTYAGADAAVIIGDGSATDCRRTYLRHLSIVGTSAGLAGVRFNSTRFCGLDNVEISGFTIPGGASVRLLADVANYFNVLKECKFNGSTYGVRLDGGTGVGANSNYIRNCHFSTHASDGVLIDAGDSNRVEDCEFNGGTATGVRLVNNAVGNVIMGNQFDGTTTMWNVATSAVTDSMFLANTGSGTVLDSGTRTVRVDTTAVSIFGWRVGTDGKTYAAPGSDTATGATAGSATLPAAPVGFFSMRKSDGTQVKVPYYGF
jgi:hypothetical protein